MSIAAAVLLASCVGVEADITVRRDLSGTARLSYTVSRSLLDSGTLDGNGRWPAIPAGKADFERTISRIGGLALRSYRERDEGGDRVFEVTLAFDHVSALAGFLSANGQQVAYTSEGGRHVLAVLFNRVDRGAPDDAANAASAYDDHFAALVKEAFSGYRFTFTITVPGDTKTYSAPMGDLLTSPRQEGLEISF
jgi:hypothetical protein